MATKKNWEAVFEKEVDLDNDNLVMVTLDTRDYFDGVLELTKFLVMRKNLVGVYVTINRPFSSLRKALESKSVDLSKLIFIDNITAMAIPTIQDTEECIYIDHPSDITTLNIAISEILRRTEQKKFLIMDTISTLLLYNDAESVEKLLHSLSNKLRLLDTNAFFISIKSEENQALEDIVSQFCDKKIEL